MKIRTYISKLRFDILEAVGLVTCTDPSGINVPVVGMSCFIPVIISKIKTGTYTFKDNIGTVIIELQDRLDIIPEIKYTIVDRIYFQLSVSPGARQESVLWLVNGRTYNILNPKIRIENNINISVTVVVSWNIYDTIFYKDVKSELKLLPFVTPIVTEKFFLKPDFYKAALLFLSNKTQGDFGFEEAGVVNFPYEKPSPFVDITAEGCGVSLVNGVYEIPVKEYEFKVISTNPKFLNVSKDRTRCSVGITYNFNFQEIINAVNKSFETNYLDILKIVGDEMTDRCLGFVAGDNYAQKVQKLIAKICDCCISPTIIECIVPSLPVGIINETSTTLSSILWGWAAIPNATSYVLQTSNTPGFENPTQVYGGALLSFEVTGLNESTTYYARYKGLSSGHIDSPWATDSAITLDPV